MTRGSGTAAAPFTVTSKDGTVIAGWVSGQGPPVVLVHGTSGSDFSWALVRPHLETRLSVYSLQRRGRGRSGDAAAYSLAREAEDLAAVVESVGKPVALVGHSFGANCCLEASLLTTGVSRLVLYEPAVALSVDEELFGRIDALVTSGRREAAVETFLSEAAGLSKDEIAKVRSSPTWEERVRSAHTLAREVRAAEAQPITPERFAGMAVPSLLLAGSESPPEYRRAVDKLAGILRHSTTHVLEGHGHAANLTGPHLLAAEILGFLRPRGPDAPRAKEGLDVVQDR
jgi:pimeloyl-ACP methyl ester carboxylesterase